MLKSNEVTEEQGKKKNLRYRTSRRCPNPFITYHCPLKKKKKMLGEGQGNHTKRLTYIPTLAQRVPGSYKSPDFRVWRLFILSPGEVRGGGQERIPLFCFTKIVGHF